MTRRSTVSEEWLLARLRARGLRAFRVLRSAEAPLIKYSRDDAAPCVPVPVSLLQKVAELVTCDAHGAWCWNHEASSWPCPMARLMQYVPDEEDRGVE